MGVHPPNVSTAQQRQHKLPTPLLSLFFSIFSPFFIVTHAFCFFCSVGRRVRRGTSIALAAKKTIALQARRGPPPDVAPILGESGASVIASLTSLAPPTVVLVPSVGQAVGKAEAAPSEVAAQPVMEVMPLPMSGRAELSSAPIVLTMAGAT